MLLLGFFTWNVWLLLIVLVYFIVSILLYLYDTIETEFHYESAFWLFIISEILIFGCLLFCCLYYDSWGYISLSSALEIPFLGCFLLLGSSLTVTGFHHLLNWGGACALLMLTILLGLFFVVMQLFEIEEIVVCSIDTSFHATSFCTVGLHFIHVLLGVIGLITMLLMGARGFGSYRCTVLTWYWHFVDYVWLFVYTFVYIC